jgi:hypothetical protein
VAHAKSRVHFESITSYLFIIRKQAHTKRVARRGDELDTAQNGTKKEEQES